MYFDIFSAERTMTLICSHRESTDVLLVLAFRFIINIHAQCSERQTTIFKSRTYTEKH